MAVNAEQKLVFFAEKLSIAEYVDKPIPFVLYNQSGAVLAPIGSHITEEKLHTAFIMDCDIPQEKILSDKNSVINNDKFIAQQVQNESVLVQQRRSYLLSDSYEEESAEILESKLDQLEFEPIAEVKKTLRKNIFEIKEIFQKKIINNTVQLSSKHNAVISKNIFNYMETILGTPAYASDYIEMIHAMKNEHNYITFSHALSVSFYAASIAKKLQLLREDIYVKGNLGRWLPVKTEKNPKISGPKPFSNQLLKYFDSQIQGLKGKYKPQTCQKLTERIHDTMHEYAKLDHTARYPSLVNPIDATVRENLVIAALNSDLGKLCIPNHIMNKTEKLTDEEWKLLKDHPLHSVAKLKELGNYPAQPLVYILGHHNLNNKVGYPLFGKPLPEEGKIITITDMYDAMTSSRHCCPARSHPEVLPNIKALFDNGQIDLPLYIVASHTFEEFNHEYFKDRIKKAGAN